jgi:RIO-like serine/threonine protein kinase
MYLSRLAAEKEIHEGLFPSLFDVNNWCYNYENGFPVPQPIEQNRHQVVMAFIDAFQL